MKCDSTKNYNMYKDLKKMLMLERWFWLIEQQQLKVITGKEYLWVLKCEVRSDTGNLQILIFYHSELVRKDYLFLKSKDYLLVFFPAPNDVINLFWWSLKYINWRQKTRQELKLQLRCCMDWKWMFLHELIFLDVDWTKVKCKKLNFWWVYWNKKIEMANPRYSAWHFITYYN